MWGGNRVCICAVIYFIVKTLIMCLIGEDINGYFCTCIFADCVQIVGEVGSKFHLWPQIGGVLEDCVSCKWLLRFFFFFCNDYHGFGQQNQQACRVHGWTARLACSYFIGISFYV
jgi:hypothetical protein